MTEPTLTSYDPLAYHVNAVSDLNPQLVAAYKADKSEVIRSFLSQGKNNFDVYICVKSGHAFVLCSPVAGGDSMLEDDPMDDPYRIPKFAMCWIIELLYDNAALRTYKIAKTFHLFKDIQSRIKRHYYIARYAEMSPYALELACLRAAPTRYGVLLNDCVEFAKAFCEELQAYCSNYQSIKDQVAERIREANSTGLSIERLSREYQSSGLFANTFLGGVDVTSYLGTNNGRIIAVVVAFLLIWPFVVFYLMETWRKSM